ncbi:MAG: helix-turn-helix transcriptional regulator [Chitinophagaceae bacterium]|nr:helix-turn-helix transcriptional regulator [Chitinophagaceae bacterium]
MEQATICLLVVTLSLWGCLLPLCYLLYPVIDDHWQRWRLIRTRFSPGRTLSFPKKKERYPAYIERSNRQYRENRSKVLSALIGKNLRTLREHRRLSLEQAAASMGIPADMLAQLESATLEVTPTLLVVTSDFYGVVIDCMIYQDLSIEQ